VGTCAAKLFLKRYQAYTPNRLRLTTLHSPESRPLTSVSYAIPDPLVVFVWYASAHLLLRLMFSGFAGSRVSYSLDRCTKLFNAATKASLPTICMLQSILKIRTTKEGQCHRNGHHGHGHSTLRRAVVINGFGHRLPLFTINRPMYK